jgi:hypothetical protein
VRSYNPFNPAFRDTVRSGINELIGGREMGGTPAQRYRAGMADMLTGGVDVVPGLDLALGVTDTVQAARGGNYGTAAMLGGATVLGMAPVIGDFASKAIRGGLDMSQAARMQRAAEQGYSGPYYHGSQRIDRVIESGSINPKRATSGPMPYFTDSPELASSYAAGKADTSLPEGGYQDFFKVYPKDIGIGGRSPITVERSWNFLDDKTKNEIRDKATRIGYENYDEASGPLTLHSSGVDASPSKSQYEYLMRSSAKGNPLTALRELWVDSGNLFNEEEKLAEIYKLAGFPAQIDQSAAPWIEAKGVLPAMLRMDNPLNTSNVDELKNSVIPTLKEAFRNSRAKTKPYGADMWDKNVRFTPLDWVMELEKDVLNNANSMVWTSIPDKVTEQLKRIGYDGIIDMGGKGGGASHSVAIPFRPDQVRSINAAFDPAKRGSGNLMAGAAGATIGLSALRNIQREEEPQPD